MILGERTWYWLSLVVVLLLAMGGAEGRPATPRSVLEASVRSGPHSRLEVALTPTGHRESPGVPVSGGPPAPYNYGPTVVREGDRYRAWWCSQLPGISPAGDDILYAESGDLDGGFAASGSPAVPVFAGRPGGFDAMHTCDPSVLKVRDRYYLYYTGAAGEHAHGNAIGVASSVDGLAWRREAAGLPIVTASGEVQRHNVYGAGQPSAVYLDGWFYLMFTDTTASGAGWNGAGQFVLRAKDPEFSERVQTLTQRGFQPAGTAGIERRHAVVDAFSADWMWVDALDAFAIAHQTGAGTTITFWDRAFTRHTYRPIVIPGPWREGPGLVRRDNGHAPVSTSDACGSIPFDVLRATKSNPAPTNLRHFGLDVTGVDACERPAGATTLLDGFAMPSPAPWMWCATPGISVGYQSRAGSPRPRERQVLHAQRSAYRTTTVDCGW